MGESLAVRTTGAWPARLDRFCAICGALIPVGLVIGNLGHELLIALGSLGWLLRAAVVKRNPLAALKDQPLSTAWFFWYATILLSLLVNGAGSKGIGHDIVFLRYPLFALALLDVSRRFPVTAYLLYGLLAGVVYAGINTISAYTIGTDLIGHPLSRYTGKLKEGQRIAGLAAFAAPFIVFWAFNYKEWPKKWSLAAALVGIVAFIEVLQTQVRTAIGACAVGFLVCALWQMRKGRAIKPVVATLVAVMLCGGIYLHAGRKMNVYNLASIYDRVYYWKVAWALFIDHPVVGVSVSSFKDAYKQKAASGTIAGFAAPDGITYQLEKQNHAHNLPLMLMASTGILGLGTFTWLFFLVVKRILTLPNPMRSGLVSWPVVFLLIGLTGFNIYHSWYQALLAFFVVLIGAISRTEAS